MSGRGLALAFGLALLLLAVLLLPLRLVLGEGLAASGVSGRVWDGRLVAAQWQGLELGDLAVALKPLSVFGAPALAVQGPQLRGLIRADGVEALTGRIGTAGLGTVRLDTVTLHFEEGTCRDASGRVAAVVAGEALAGALSCAGDAAQAGMVRADGVTVATLRLGADGGVQVQAP